MDWNIQVDVTSAKYVLENSNPTLIPMTITVETALRRAYLPALKQSGKLGEVLALQVETANKEYSNEEKIGKTCKGLPDDILNFQHDPLACAVALGWNGVTIVEVPLKFEIKDNLLHETIHPEGKRTRVVTKVENERFNEFWLKIVTAS